MTALPLYQCHKKVNAVKIAAIEFKQDGSASIAPVGGKSRADTIYTAPDYRDKFKGSEDDRGYYVVYGDGYVSWSPTKAFEEGYTKL